MRDIKFKKISLEDKEIIDLYINKYYPSCLSAFTFSSLISWVDFYNYEWAISDETLLIKFTDSEDKKEYLFQPIGEFPLSLQEEIIRYAEGLDYKIKIHGVSEEFISKYPEFSSHFKIESRRDMDNYIYSADDLAELKGGNYQPKRNLIKQFESNYNWTSELISLDNISACFEVISGAHKQNEISKDTSLDSELAALEFVLKNFAQLGSRGF